MSRRVPFLVLALALAGGAATAAPAHADALVSELRHERLAGDVWHTSFVVHLGDSPNARVRLHRVVRERAPGLPRPTRGGVVLLHGDFSSFGSNFAPVTLDPTAGPGLATWLAQERFDVWGIDRRWAVTAADGDTSDFGAIGFAQELDDLDRALVIARTLRAFTGAGAGPLHVVGFSRGGFLAYAAAAIDGARPPFLRQIAGLVPLDVWAAIPPEDTAARARVCESAFFERADLEAGVVDSDNFFFIRLGELAASAPDEPSPFLFLGGVTNRQALFVLAAQTYFFFTPTDHYHLAAGDVLDDGSIGGLLESPEPAVATWFATASPHQSLREAAETDSVWCGDGSGPFTVDLAQVRAPLLYLGAAGGYGDRGVYSTTRVGSTDVTVHVVTRGGDPFEDVGHGDLLFGTDAPALAWRPLAAWLAAH